MELTGRVVLVTGGARRIGAALSRSLVEAGAQLILHYHRSSTEALALAAELGDAAWPVQADLTDRTQRRALLDQIAHRYGRLDVLVYSASAFVRTPFARETDDGWEEALAVNLTAPAMTVQAALPLLGPGSAVIFLADIAGERGYPYHAAYSAARAGLLNLTRTLAVELAPAVRVNAVAPGVVLWPDHGDPALQTRLEAGIPLRRVGDPAAVVEAVRYLIRQAFVTGEVLHVDGGRSARP